MSVCSFRTDSETARASRVERRSAAMDTVSVSPSPDITRYPSSSLMDEIIWFKGMFVVGYSCDVASCPAVIDFSEWEGREGGDESPQRGGDMLYTR